MMETPLKGKGGRLQHGWETWRTVPGVNRAPQAGSASSGTNIFSPLDVASGRRPEDGGEGSDTQGSASGFGGGSGSSGSGGSEPGDADPVLQEEGSGGPAFVPPRLQPSLLRKLGAAEGSGSRPPTPTASAPASLAHGGVHSMWDFLMRELQWGHMLSWRQRGTSSEHVMNFLCVTLSLEPFLHFGHLLCIDLFLFHFTMLPLRCVAALWRLLCVAVTAPCSRGKSCQGAPVLTQAQAYDLLKGALFVAATLALGAVQVSRVYHYIRGEAIIKLCVFPPPHSHFFLRAALAGGHCARAPCLLLPLTPLLFRPPPLRHPKVRYIQYFGDL